MDANRGVRSEINVIQVVVKVVDHVVPVQWSENERVEPRRRSNP